MTFMVKRLLLAMLLLVPMADLAAAASPSRRNNIAQEPLGQQEASQFQKITTDDYVVQTDLPAEQLPEVLQRLSTMARVYRDRTANLSSLRDDRRLPFFLYASRDAYIRAGGSSASAGLFDGDRLLAYVGEKADARSWHVIQHEAFHQYLVAKLGYDVPIWLNEGLAEYFGEGMFTGDGFVTGLVPDFRLKRIREAIKSKTHLPFDRLITMTHDRWNDALSYKNYDVAWSLVHFLAHADGGKHQAALTMYIQASAKGANSLRTFEQMMGKVSDVERMWQQYWLELPEDEIRRGWAMAAVQIVNSFVARATVCHQRVTSLDELQDLVSNGKLQQPRASALPTSMLDDCLQLAPDLGEWMIDPTAKARANVTLKLKTGEQVHAKFTLRNGNVQATDAWYVPPPRAQGKGTTAANPK